MLKTNPNHKHTYDAQGNVTCCSLEEKLHAKQISHELGEKENSPWREYQPAIISFVLLITGIVLDNFIQPIFFTEYIRLAWYVAAYIPVGFPVMKDAVKSISKGAFFSEFFLMSIATIGAFFINQYPEGVAVMLFYSIGELFQSAAVNKAKRSIKALLDIRPDEVTVSKDGKDMKVAPSEVEVGQVLRIKPGEKIAVSGVNRSGKITFLELAAGFYRNFDGSPRVFLGFIFCLESSKPNSL